MSTLNEFIASVKQYGVMSLNRYIINIPLPDSCQGVNVDLRTLNLHCERVALPDLSISTQPSTTYGERVEMPYERLFGNINMTFLVDGHMDAKQFFDTWIHSIQDPNTRQMRFYKEYVVDIDISVLDKSDKEQYKIKLYQCYPKQVSAIQMDYSSKEIMTLDVNMNYRYWEHFRPDAGPVTNTAPSDTPFDDRPNQPNLNDSSRFLPRF